jgi:hypothetical protein
MDAKKAEVAQLVQGERVDGEWVGFPGGELEGVRPKALCPGCRTRLKAGSVARAGRGRTICFLCYRAELERQRAIKAAGELDTASEARFQEALPFEPVNKPRLERLRCDRSADRAAARRGIGVFADHRRHAQMAARHALQAIAVGLTKRNLAAADRDRMLSAATRAAELQLPESWLPFVVAR